MRIWDFDGGVPNRPLAMAGSGIIPQDIVLGAIGRRFSVSCTNRKTSGLELRQPTVAGLELNGNVRDRRGCFALLRLWLRIQGHKHLVPWLEKISLETGLCFKAIQIRSQKTRWGSCSSRGTISLNCKLLFLPPHLVNYIMIHELCHTVHLNHSLQFWSFLSSFEPACKVLDVEIKQAGRLVPEWASGLL